MSDREILALLSSKYSDAAKETEYAEVLRLLREVNLQEVPLPSIHIGQMHSCRYLKSNALQVVCTYD
jgi:hypothetical protein